MPAFRLTSGFKSRPKGYARGKEAQAAGRHFQDVVTASAGIYKDIVAIEPLPALGAKRIAGGSLVPTKIAVDCMGCFKGGFALHFDAKSVGEHTGALDCGSMIAEHQLLHLRRMKKMGAIAGFLVEAKRWDQYLWLDVAHVTGYESLPFAREKLWIPLGSLSGYVRFDWLYKAVLPTAEGRSAI